MTSLRPFTVRQSQYPFAAPAKVLGTVHAPDLRAARALAATDPRFRGQAVTVEHQHARPVRPVREVRP